MPLRRNREEERKKASGGDMGRSRKEEGREQKKGRRKDKHLKNSFTATQTAKKIPEKSSHIHHHALLSALSTTLLAWRNISATGGAA